MFTAKYFVSIHICNVSMLFGSQRFDDLLRSALSTITNNALSDSQRRQASLSVKFGGLSIRRVFSLVLASFLASKASTLVLQDEILGGSQPLSDSLAESLKSRWVALYGPAPTGRTELSTYAGVSIDDPA